MQSGRYRSDPDHPGGSQETRYLNEQSKTLPQRGCGYFDRLPVGRAPIGLGRQHKILVYPTPEISFRFPWGRFFRSGAHIVFQNPFRHHKFTL